jgi:hypothetical protein
VANNIIGLYESVEMIYASQLLGYPGSLEKNISPFVNKNIESLIDLINDVNDAAARRLLGQVLHTTQAFLVNDRNMKSWVEDFTGQSMTKIRKISKLSIQKQDKKGLYTSDASLPAWVKESEYMKFGQDSSNLMKSLVDEFVTIFELMSKLSNGVVPNWSEEQKKKGRFSHMN